MLVSLSSLFPGLFQAFNTRTEREHPQSQGLKMLPLAFA